MSSSVIEINPLYLSSCRVDSNFLIILSQSEVVFVRTAPSQVNHFQNRLLCCIIPFC
nr:MAG TPA: hypothetical protein [Caudoviricetes sp.]